MNEAYRLTFEIDGDRLAVKSVRRLAMRVPPGQSQRDMAENLSGRFVELRGANGEPLYRRAITEALPGTVEFPTGDPERPFGRVPARRKEVISVLVPARSDGRSVAIIETVGVAPRMGAAAREGAGTRELVSVPLPEQEAGDGRR